MVRAVLVVSRHPGQPHRLAAYRDALNRKLAGDNITPRPLAAGEGRVARISGYVDGFRIWKTLFDEGYDGIIRGDEAFGSVPVSTPYAVRSTAGLTMLSDYFSHEERETFELPEQHLPERLARGRGETLATWRDRLYQQFRIPTLLAGLTDVKTAYVEVGSPLLARSVLACVRALPDALRTEKCLWREIAGERLPDVALATRVAIASLADILADRRVREILLAELSSERSVAVLSPLLRRARCCAALRAAGCELAPTRRERRGRPLLLRAVPARLRTLARNWRVGHAGLEPLVLAFRAFVAVRMHAQRGCDAATPPGRLEPALNA